MFEDIQGDWDDDFIHESLAKKPRLSVDELEASSCDAIYEGEDENNNDDNLSEVEESVNLVQNYEDFDQDELDILESDNYIAEKSRGLNENDYEEVSSFYENFAKSLGDKSKLFMKSLEISTKNRAKFVALAIEKEETENFEENFEENVLGEISEQFLMKASEYLKATNSVSQSSSDYIASLSPITADGVAVFSQSDTDCTSMHMKLTLELIDTIVRNLDSNPTNLINYLIEIGQSHRSLKDEGMNVSMWDDFGDAILEGVRRNDMVRKHKELRRAWLAIIAFLTDHIKQGLSTFRVSPSMENNDFRQNSQ